MARPKRIKVERKTYKKAYTFFKFIKPYKISFYIGMLFLLLSSSTAMVFPYLMGQLLGGGEGNQDSVAGMRFDFSEYVNFNNLENIVLVMVFVFAAQAIFSFFRIYLFGYFTANALRDLREASFLQLIKSPMTFYNKNKVGELTSRIATDINILEETLNSTLATFMRQLITVVISLLFLFVVSPKLCLVMLSVVPVVAVIAVFFGIFIKKISKETQDFSAQSNSVLEESLVGISNVKAFANEFFEILRYNKAVSSIKDKNMKLVFWRGLFVMFIIFCMFGAIVFVIWQGKLMVNAGEINNSDFISFILYTVFVGGAISSLPESYAKIQKTAGATESLMSILDEDVEEIKMDKIQNPLNLKGDVVFKDVSFSYKSRSDFEVLNSINLEVSGGKKIALVGSSGSGKSTLSRLLLQFYKPISGEILFDNKSSSDFELSELRNEMAVVPQEVILFGGTVKENIRYGNLEATEEEIIEAAKGANAHDFISEFPDGYDTFVGDRGIQLSGGQKQRVAIARAILKNPSILILDEATSSLDSESELLVQEAVDRLMKGRTSFVIAHRLSTIKNCDEIIVLDNGKIIERGIHDELVQIENGVYRNLSEIQYR